MKMKTGGLPALRDFFIDNFRMAGIPLVICAYLLLLAPIPVVIITSFSSAPYLRLPPEAFSLKWYSAFLHSREFLGSLQFSLLLAILTTVLTLGMSFFAALGLVRHRFRGKRIIESLLILPLFFPRIALAIALLLFFAQIGIAGTLLGLLLAHVVITLPYAVRTLMGSLSGMDPHIEEAALSLGANWLRTIWEVTLPLIRPGLIASGVFVFIISLDEVVISLFLAGPAQIPLSVRIFTYIQYTTDPTIAAISTVLMTISVMLFVLAPKEFLTGRGILR